MHKDLESTRLGRAHMRLNIYSIKDLFRRSLRYRYKVICDWPSPTAMIPIAEAASMQQQWSLMGWACGVVHEELGDLECQCPSKNGEYDQLLQCIQVSYTAVMAMAIMSTEREPHGRHRVKTRLILWLEISLRLLCLIPTMTYTLYELRVRDWMVRCRTFQKWRYGGRCHIGCSFSSRLFTSLLLWISAHYKWRRHGFLPPPEMNQVEVEFPHAPDPPNGYHTVLIGSGTYWFVRLCTLNCCLIVSFPFLLLFGFMHPRGSAPTEGDNVMAQQYVTCPGPGNNHFI
jgi:hypothetical protein